MPSNQRLTNIFDLGAVIMITIQPVSLMLAAVLIRFGTTPPPLVLAVTAVLGGASLFWIFARSATQQEVTSDEITPTNP